MDITRDNLLKLIQDGRKNLDLSIAALERDSGVPKDTVRDFLRGKTQILRADKLQKLLRVLQPSEKLAVSAILSAGAEVVPLETAGEFVDYPPGMQAGDIAALRVQSDAMAPVFPPGWIIYYELRPMEERKQSKSGWQVPYGASNSSDPYGAFLGKPCVILLESEKMLRTLKQGSEPGKYTLIAYNAADLQNVAVKDVYKISFIKAD